MLLKDFIEKLQEADRESFKKEVERVEGDLAKAIIINTKEDAIKLLKENQLLKGAKDAEISTTYENMEKKFKEEKLPALLEAERLKGQKQPWEVEIEKIKAENAQAKKELALAQQKTRAIQKAQELDLPLPLIEKFIGETDEATDEQLKYLVEGLKPWAEKKEQAIRQSLVGNNGEPDKAGRNPNAVQMKRSEFDKLPLAEKSNAVKQLQTGAVILTD